MDDLDPRLNQWVPVRMNRRRARRNVLIKSPINPKVLKFRKYLTLPRSEMDLLYSFTIDPMTMRNALKKFIKTSPIDFKTSPSYWPAQAGYICTHIRGITRKEDKNQIMPYRSEMVNKTKLHNFLKRCKNLEALKVYTKILGAPLLRSLRYMHQVKSLYLVLEGDKMKESPKMVRYLSCLRYVCLKIKESFQNSSEQIILGFFKHLVKLKSLQKIELDLQELCNPDCADIIESVLQLIGKMDVDFNIKLCLTGVMLKANDIKCILATTETLVLQYRKYDQNTFETNTKLEPERSRIVQQGRRVLNLTLMRAEEVDFIPFVKACSSLQTFWIEAECYMLKASDITDILATTETLILQYQKYGQNKLETNTKLEHERSRIIQQGRRVLHLTFKKAKEVDFIPFVRACSSLQTFWVQAECYLILLLDQFSLPKTFKNLFVVFPFLGSKAANQLLSYLIPAFENVETLEKLFFFLPIQESVEQIDQIKELKCIRNSTKYDLTVCHVPGFLNQISGNTFLSLCSPITTMSSLKSLKLDFEKSLIVHVGFIQKVLDSLPSTLEQFELVISVYDGSRIFKLYFPFEMLSRLTEFRLDLCNSLSLDHFTKEFVKMKELEVMVVKGKCFADPEFNVQDIMDGLTQMKKIRDVQVLAEGNELFRFKNFSQGLQARETKRNGQVKRFRNW